jgi:V/A-type H+/Na+-transporting ATPase subunit F
LAPNTLPIVKIVTVGSRIFVTSFQLAGVQGVIADNPQTAFSEIKKLADDPDVGLVLLSEDISAPISMDLTKLRATKSKPLIFSLPSVGSEKNEVDYRKMLKTILGV